MALGFTRQTSNEDYLPILKYNSISGDLTLSTSKKEGEEWVKDEKENFSTDKAHF